MVVLEELACTTNGKESYENRRRRENDLSTIISPPKMLGGTRTIRLGSVELTTQVFTPGMPGMPGIPIKKTDETKNGFNNDLRLK